MYVHKYTYTHIYRCIYIADMVFVQLRHRPPVVHSCETHHTSFSKPQQLADGMPETHNLTGLQ